MFYSYSNSNSFDNDFRNSYDRGLWGGIKYSFRQGSSLTKLIYINIGVFFLIKLLKVVFIFGGIDFNFYDRVLTYVGVPADAYLLLRQPWTLFTYMFTHFEFFHLLFNMLWLYWFGKLFLTYFSGRKMIAVYVMGGVCGALLYVLMYNTIPYFANMRYFSKAIGASASVMAIVFAVCTYLPHHRVYLFLIGSMKLIHLALITAVIDLLSISSSNAGGHIAHLGGALFGILFTLAIRKNYDLTAVPVELIDRINRFFKQFRKPKMSTKGKNPKYDSARRTNKKTTMNEEDINIILDKISRSGYDSLTKSEKEILFRSGNN